MAGFTGWKRQQGRYKKSTQKKAQLITGHGIVTAWGDVRQTAPGVWCCYRAAAVPAAAVPATTTAAVDSNASHRRLPAIDFPQECHGPGSIQLPPGKLVTGPHAHDVGTPSNLLCAEATPMLPLKAVLDMAAAKAEVKAKEALIVAVEWALLVGLA